MEGGGDVGPEAQVPSLSLAAEVATQANVSNDAQNTSVLKLKGLPFSATEQDLRDFFTGFQVNKTAVHIGHDGRPSGLVRARELRSLYEGPRRRVGTLTCAFVKSCGLLNQQFRNGAFLLALGGAKETPPPEELCGTRLTRLMRHTQGFAEFVSPEEAGRAMTRDRAFMGPRFVKLLRVPKQEVRVHAWASFNRAIR